MCCYERRDLARDLAEQSRSVFDSLGAQARSAAVELLIARLDVRDGINLDHALEASENGIDRMTRALMWSMRSCYGQRPTLPKGISTPVRKSLSASPVPGIGLVTNGLGLLSKRLHELCVGPNLLIGAKITLHLLRLWKKRAVSACRPEGKRAVLNSVPHLPSMWLPPPSLISRERYGRTTLSMHLPRVSDGGAASHRSLAPSGGVSADLARKLARLRWLRLGGARCGT